MSLMKRAATLTRPHTRLPARLLASSRIRTAFGGLAVGLLLAACGGDESPPEDTGGVDVGTDVAPDCGGCPEGKLCCPSHFEGDIPRCVDPSLNPENCGTCGTSCSGACQEGRCVDAPACGDGQTCAEGTACSGEGELARCCPEGTTFIASPADFFGCCPDGDICGCREGMCPISRAEWKKDIRYLPPDEVAAIGARLLETRLATWRYLGEDGARPRLGFIIGEGAPEEAVVMGGHRVDLYGYISAAVAALQAQARELDALRGSVRALERRLEALERAPR